MITTTTTIITIIMIVIIMIIVIVLLHVSCPETTCVSRERREEIRAGRGGQREGGTGKGWRSYKSILKR
jgi:hypothetical protein